MAHDDDLDRAIDTVGSPRAGHGHALERKRALEYLLERGDAAHQRLLERLGALADTPFASALVAVLPVLGRAESVPVLESLVGGRSEAVRMAAAEALAKHPAREAGEALLRLISDSRAEVVALAADGLGSRGDRALAGALDSVLTHADGTARYHATQAAAALGRLTEQQLERIANVDSDPSVRDLARRLRSRK